MRGRDPEHWLYRFDTAEWLSAAHSELTRARAALEGKQHRAGVTQALRAAGMAWNAVLVATEDEHGYGRSYRDHLVALAADEATPMTVRAAARSIVEAPLTAQVVQLGRGDTTMAAMAEVVIAHARERVRPTGSG